MSLHTLTGAGDLAMISDLRPYIRTVVQLVKRTKSGKYQVRAHDGTLITVPKRNLEPPPEDTSA